MSERIHKKGEISDAIQAATHMRLPSVCAELREQAIKNKNRIASKLRSRKRRQKNGCD